MQVILTISLVVLIVVGLFVFIPAEDTNKEPVVIENKVLQEEEKAVEEPEKTSYVLVQQSYC